MGALLSVGALASGGCGANEATVTERLWISAIPKHPKAPLTAFVTTRTTGGKYLGAFFRGSVLRGGHDVFEWKVVDAHHAKLTFLQDGVTADLRFERCEPTRGFDRCILVHGDPTGTVRYESRKRWAVKPPRRKDAAGTSAIVVFAELAADDPELARLLEP